MGGGDEPVLAACGGWVADIAGAEMSVSFYQLFLYACGMAALWAVPGPVWVALMARSLSGGFASAWPLAVGVTLGDCLWPALAIFGMGWVLGVYGDALTLLRWVAAV